MSFVSRIIGTAERVPLPDVVIRAAIQRMCSRTATRLAGGEADNDVSFAQQMLINRLNKNSEPPKEEIVDSMPGNIKNVKKVKPKLSTS